MSCEVDGLNDWLKQLKIKNYVGAVKWCEETGATELEEILDGMARFAQHSAAIMPLLMVSTHRQATTTLVLDKYRHILR